MHKLSGERAEMGEREGIKEKAKMCYARGEKRGRREKAN